MRSTARSPLPQIRQYPTSSPPPRRIEWRAPARPSSARAARSSTPASSGAAGRRRRLKKASLREVMLIDRDWRHMEGRWFTGGYDEVGLDIKLDRVAGDTRVLGTDRTALKQGASGQELKIYGQNIPAALRAADIDLGTGITVTQSRQRDARCRDRHGRRRRERCRTACAIYLCLAPHVRGRSPCLIMSTASR